jgi:hypothetical protein
MENKRSRHDESTGFREFLGVAIAVGLLVMGVLAIGVTGTGA